MLEAGFLVLLAVVVGFADLSPALIVLVMLVGWLLVALIEYFAWRQAHGVPLRPVADGPAGPVEDDVVEPAPIVHEEVADVAPPPPPPEPAAERPPEPPPEPAPVPEEETIVQTPAASEQTETVAESDARVSAARRSFAEAEEEARVRHRLDPLQPRPRRKWILFGPYQRPEAPAEDDREEEH